MSAVVKRGLDKIFRACQAGGVRAGQQVVIPETLCWRSRWFMDQGKKNCESQDYCPEIAKLLSGRLTRGVSEDGILLRLGPAEGGFCKLHFECRSLTGA